MVEYINKTKKEVVLMEYSELKKRHFGNNDTDKKLTDEEIIKALECLFGCVDCRKCSYSPRYKFPLCQRQVAKDTRDIIIRQQAETLRLKSMNQAKLDTIHDLQTEIERLKECPRCFYEYDGEVTEYCVQAPCPNFKTVEQIKTEAYKEFAGIIKDKWFDNRYDSPDVDFDDFISNLLKNGG